MSVTKAQVNKLLKAIARCNDSSSDALEELYNSMGGIMMSMAIGIVGNRATAEDVVQEAFIKIVNNADKFRIFDNGYGWVLTITRNTALNKLKTQKNSVNIDSIFDIASTSEDNDTCIAVEEALTTLPEKERIVIVMKYYEDKTIRQIAHDLNMPFSTVQSTITRAEKKLKILLE